MESIDRKISFLPIWLCIFPKTYVKWGDFKPKAGSYVQYSNIPVRDNWVLLIFFLSTYSQPGPSFIYKLFVQYSQSDLTPLRPLCGEAPRWAEIRTWDGRIKPGTGGFFKNTFVFAYLPCSENFTSLILISTDNFRDEKNTFNIAKYVLLRTDKKIYFSSRALCILYIFSENLKGSGIFKSCFQQSR